MPRFAKRPARRRPTTRRSFERLEDRRLLAANLELVADIVPGSASSLTSGFVQIESSVVFAATTPAFGRELFVTDGTAVGTRLLSDIRPGTAASSPAGMIQFGNYVYFAATTDAGGRELHRTDGITAGNTLFADIAVGAASSSPANFTISGGLLYFTAQTTSGTELWRTDGTPGGTFIVVDSNPGTASGSPQHLTNWNGTLYFTAVHPATGRELYRTGGTAATTVAIAEIRPGTQSSFPVDPYLTVVGDRLFLMGDNGVLGRELWMLPSPGAPPTLVKDIRPGGTGSWPIEFEALGDRVYFVADDGIGGAELWTSDGTAAGTAQLLDIIPGPTASSPSALTTIGSLLYFRAFDSFGSELWRTDGTTSGTFRLTDVNPGAGYSTPQKFAAGGGGIVFAANDGSQQGIYFTDGTIAGTELIAYGQAGSLTTLPAGIFGGIYQDVAIGSEPYRITFPVANPPLSDITLSGTSVDENAPAGTLVGVLTTEPADTPGVTYAFSNQYPDSSNFTILGNELRTNAPLDREAFTDGITVEIVAQHSSGTVSKTFQIIINPVNEFPPRFNPFSQLSVPENRSFVTTLEAFDEDVPVGPITYSIVGGPDAGFFNINGDQLSFNNPPDYEFPGDADSPADGRYEITVRASDGELFSDESITIEVTDLNEAPNDIELSSNTIAENAAPGTVIGTLTATDLDFGDTTSIILVAGPGDTDNGLFLVVGNQLTLDGTLDYETATSHSIRLIATDAAGLSYEEVFTINVTDVDETPIRPIASDITASTDRNVPLPLTLSVAEPAGPVSYFISQPPTHGALSGTAPNLTYTPFANYSGTDEFYYTATRDGLTSFEARAALTVIGVRPTVRFTRSASTRSETAGSETIVAQLDQPTDVDIDVLIAVDPTGTATANQDFRAPTFIRIPAGQFVASAPLTILDDPIDEVNETIDLRIATSGQYIVDQDSTWQVTIIDDDDPPVIRLLEKSLVVTEGFLVPTAPIFILSSPAAVDIDIPFTIAGTATPGSDYGPIPNYENINPSTGIVRIPAGESQGRVIIPLRDDADPELTETVIIYFFTPNYGVLPSSENTFTLSIRDNDTPSVSMSQALVSVPESVGTVRVTATRVGDTTNALTVPAYRSGSAAMPSDYQITGPVDFVFAPVRAPRRSMSPSMMIPTSNRRKTSC